MKNFMAVISITMIVGCSSAEKIQLDRDDPTLPREYDGPGYVTREQSPRQQPLWSEDFEKFKKSNDGKGMTYYFGESGDVNDRIAGCELASQMAKRKISEQIAQMIISKMGSGKSGTISLDRDSRAPSSLGSNFQDVIATQSSAFLVGVQELGRYWEDRDYTPSGGRRRVFHVHP